MSTPSPAAVAYEYVRGFLDESTREYLDAADDVRRGHVLHYIQHSGEYETRRRGAVSPATEIDLTPADERPRRGEERLKSAKSTGPVKPKFPGRPW